jgi:hypothetical protein
MDESSPKEKSGLKWSEVLNAFYLFVLIFLMLALACNAFV